MDEIPESFWLGVEQFNQQQFYACHDTLEAIWIEAPTADKNFYQGILQIAVALYHLGNQNLRGAVILMGEGLNRLRSYQPTYAEIDVDDFLSTTADLLIRLQHTPPDQVARLAQQLADTAGDRASKSGDPTSDIRVPMLRRVSPDVS